MDAWIPGSQGIHGSMDPWMHGCISPLTAIDLAIWPCEDTLAVSNVFLVVAVMCGSQCGGGANPPKAKRCRREG